MIYEGEERRNVEIDLVKYGVLWQKVQDYERRFDQMSEKLDK